ncbi:MAG: hypothetical protein ACJA06_000783 [Halocynthiibacter sp.]|jgi:hypothetical protein
MKHIFPRTIALLFATLSSLSIAAPAHAENFTTAAEVRPILAATKAQWIAVRQYDGADLLYFTNLLAWRCGLERIEYAINGAPAELLNAEPCHEGEAVPNALKVEDQLPYIRLPLASLQSVEVIITYDDGASETASFQRKDIEIN